MPNPTNTDWKEPKPRIPAPRIDPVFIWPTPNEEDFIFFVERNGDLPFNKNWVYGTPFPDNLKYPKHKLVFVAPQTDDKWSRWYYASDRLLEDEYNWSLNAGQELTRTYLVARDLYYERSIAEAAAVVPPVDGEFTYPVIGTADTRFVKYGFADDAVTEAPEQLSSHYIVVRRRYIEPITSELAWSEEFQRNIRVTREIIPAVVYPTPPAQVPGSTIEIKKGNRFHDVRITQEVLVGALGSDPDYPYEKASVPDYRDFTFPSVLNSIELVWAWAWASSTGNPQSYSEDFYFKFDITDPRPGPYSATIRRFITDDPESIRTSYPRTYIPPTKRETIAVVYSWFFASVSAGNSTAATANEQQLPSCIHDDITVSEGGTEPDTTRDRNYTSTFAATPGYGDFMALTSAVIGYEARELQLGLFEVTVIEIDIEYLYEAPPPPPQSP